MIARVPRALASSALVALMVLPTLAPSVEASHTNPVNAFEPARLDYDPDECLAAWFTSEQAAFQRLFAERSQAGLERFVRHDANDVPSFCAPAANTAEGGVVTAANLVIDQLNSVLHFFENQTSFMQETYMPLNRTPFLFDDFQGTRIGGYGDWKVLAAREQGNASDWYLDAIEERYGQPDVGWRFGGAQGYGLDRDVALVSPEIDLAPVDVNRVPQSFCASSGVCYDQITGPRAIVESAAQDASSLGSNVANAIRDSFNPLLTAWENQAAVTLTVRHRYNFAAFRDGVRWEVFTHEPTEEDLKRGRVCDTTISPTVCRPDGFEVAYPSAPTCANTPPDEVARPDFGSTVPVPDQVPEGGTLPGGSTPLDHDDFFPSPPCDRRFSQTVDEPTNVPSDPTDPLNGASFFLANAQSATPLTPRSEDQYVATSAFAQTCYRPDGNPTFGRCGFSLHSAFNKGGPPLLADTAWKNATFDLSRYAGKSVWLVAHVRTAAGADDVFADEQRFPVPGDWGYFLDSVNVTAKVKMHNIRVKGLAWPDLPLQDAETKAWEQTLFPSSAPTTVAFYVTNVGRYVDNVTVAWSATRNGTATSALPAKTETRVLSPGHVWEASYTIPFAINETDRFELTLTASLDSSKDSLRVPSVSTDDVGGNVTNNVDFNATQVDLYQPRDEAITQTAADNTATAKFLVTEKESIAFLGANRAGDLVHIDPALAEKDRTRDIAVRVKNVGNTIEDLVVVPVIRSSDGTQTFRDFFVGAVEQPIGVLEPNESKEVRWQVRPYASDAYELTIHLLDAADPTRLVATVPGSLERSLYVGRTAGTVCGDDLATERACVPAWELAKPEALDGVTQNAVWRAPSGEIWAAGDDGLAFKRSLSGAWTRVPVTIGGARVTEDLHAVWGPASDLVYFAGENGTLLRYDGTWQRVPKTAGLAEGADDGHKIHSISYFALWGWDARTVYAGGESGYVLRLNTSQDPDRFEIFDSNESSRTDRAPRTVRAIGGTPHNVLAVGDDLLARRWNGTRWSAARLDAATVENLTRGENVADLLVVALEPAGLFIAGEDGSILRWNATRNRTAFLRTDPIGSPDVRGLVTTVDGTWALGTEGLALRCDDCDAAGRNWSAASSGAPFVTRVNAPPEIDDAGPVEWYVDEGDDVEYRLAYVDPEGVAPERVTLAVSKGTETPKRYDMRKVPGVEGEYYAIVTGLKLGRHNASFTVSDGVHEQKLSVKEFPVVGGECKSGQLDAASSTTNVPEIYPQFPGFVCAGKVSGSDTKDYYNVDVDAGQTVRIVASCTTSQAAASNSFTYTFNGPVTIACGAAPDARTYAMTASGLQQLLIEYKSALPLNQGGAALAATVSYSLEITITGPPEPQLPAYRASTPATTASTARLLAAVHGVVSDGAGNAVAVLEGGGILQRSKGSRYDNFGDWNPDFHLEPTNEWAWVTHAVTTSGTLRAAPLQLDPLHAPGTYDEVVLRVRHRVLSVYSPNQATAGSAGSPDYPEIRLAFAPTAEAIKPPVVTNPLSCAAGSTQLYCGTLSYSTVRKYSTPTPHEGWFEETIPLKQYMRLPWLNPDTRFVGVDFRSPSNPTGSVPDFNRTRWAVDLVEVKARSGDTWTTILYFNGNATQVGTIGPVAEVFGAQTSPVIAGSTSAPTWLRTARPFFERRNSDGVFEPWTAARGDPEPGSLWHRSSLTDSATWVANTNTDTGPGLGDLTGYRNMLVTPAVDLRQAFDPVLEFDHAFVGRTIEETTTNPVCLNVVDSGSVWMQVLLDNGEWSRFYRVDPVGGYPGRGWHGAPNLPACGKTPIGNVHHQTTFDYGQGFYGRNVEPSSTGGSVENALRADLYERVRINLTGQRNSPCGWNCNSQSRDALADAETVPGAGGEIVRFGFMFNMSQYGASFSDARPAASPRHGGWYVRDVRVLGERVLGNDLSLVNASIGVGYDWEKIGVGPDTIVPIFANATNAGRYAVAGAILNVSVHKVTDSSRLLKQHVVSYLHRYDATLAPGETRPFFSNWSVPELAAGEKRAQYLLTVTITPLGATDEDAADNSIGIGDFTTPVLAEPRPDVRAHVVAFPRAESSDVKRYLAVSVNNTGNVPVTGIEITRRIQERRGSQGDVLVEERKWLTTEPAPPGAVTIVSGLVPADTFDVEQDLYWRPPGQANYLVTVLVKAPGLALTRQQVLVESYTTYFFDDFEEFPKGVAFRGAWRAEEGWNLDVDEGFDGSRLARQFGYGDARRYASGSNASLVTPVLDLASATTAKLAFYHKYDFEEGYDGGVVEASTDGGVNWQRLVPRATEAGSYSPVRINAASPIDPAHDPLNELTAFTGSSSARKGNVSGFVLSEFNLGQIEGLVEPTTYESFDVQSQQTTRLDACAFGPDTCKDRPYRADPSFAIGSKDEQRYWEVQNFEEAFHVETAELVAKLAQEPLPGRPPLNLSNGFLWSGSPMEGDDGRRAANPGLVVPLDLSAVPLGAGERIELRLWEYMRHDKVELGHESEPGNPAIGKYVYLRKIVSGAGLESYRTNLAGEADGPDTEYAVSERHGNWWRWSADLTHIARRENPDDRRADLQLILESRASGNWLDGAATDPGWIIDGLQVVRVRDEQGRAVDVGTILSVGEGSFASTLGALAEPLRTIECAERVGSNLPSCRPSAERPEGLVGPEFDATGARTPASGVVWTYVERANWTFVDTAYHPDADVTGWTVLNLNSAEDRKFVAMKDARSARVLPTGEDSLIFWAGEKVSPTSPNLNRPNGRDTRLVTPAIDLSRVAGDTASLSFAHMYAFWNDSAGVNNLQPNWGGRGDFGVIEIQVFDREADKWGEWRQLYREGIRGARHAGYPNAIPARYLELQTLHNVYVGAPLERHPTPATRTESYYAFAGSSATRPGSTLAKPWIHEEFDLSSFVGERVRVGFRYFTSQASPSEGLVHPAAGQGGWFLDDVKIRGDTIAGKPVILRFRAGTDATQNDGGWIIDDIAVSGSTYRRNVGVFITETPVGAGPNRTAEIQGTLRNLGDTVRRNLAIEVIDATLDANGAPPRLPLNFTTLPGAIGSPRVGANPVRPSALLADVNLPPRGSADFAFSVKVPAGAGAETRRIAVRVVEWNEALGVFLPVTDNEVEGFLNRELAFKIVPQAAASFFDARVDPGSVSVGEKTRLTLEVANTQVIPITLNATCVAQRVLVIEPVDHRQFASDSVIYGPEIPCKPVDAKPAIAQGRRGNATFDFTPPEAGVWRVSMNARFVDDAEFEGPVGDGKPRTFTFLAGLAPFWLRDDLENEDVRDAWLAGPVEDGQPDVEWKPTEDRAHTEKWSFRGGLSDEAFAASTSATYVGPSAGAPIGHSFAVRSPPLDLHNASGDLYLRFWHMPRLAQFDGADVRVEVLLDEINPDTGWSKPSDPCKIFPVDRKHDGNLGYDGPVWSYFPGINENAPQPGYDANADFAPGEPLPQNQVPLGPRASNDPANSYSLGMGGAEKVYFTGFANDWRLAEFELSQVRCDFRQAGQMSPTHPLASVPLVGHTVRFVFTVFTGLPDDNTNGPDPLARGRGQGWFVDDLHVSAYNFEMAPAAGTYTLTDNATKSFVSRVDNTGGYSDRVSARVDERISFVPENSASVSIGKQRLAPGDSTVMTTTLAMPRNPGDLPLTYSLRVLAESGVDPNLVRERVLTLNFAPNEYPDLKLSMEAPNRVVQEGTPAYVTLVIENNGLATSPAPALKVVERAGSETREWTIPASRLRSIPSFQEKPAESTLLVELRDESGERPWTPLPGRGVHTLTVIVDPEDRISEYTKRDNSFTLPIEVSKLLRPDIVLDERDVTVRVNGQRVAPETAGTLRTFEIEENDVVTFDAIVLNDGPVGATNVDVAAFIGPLALPPRTIPFIPAGSSVPVTFTWLAQKGDWQLSLRARTDLVELDDLNNRVPRDGAIVLTAKGFDVSVAFEAPRRLLAPGESITLDVAVPNAGKTGEEVRLVALLPEGWKGAFRESAKFLPKGSTGDAATRVPLTITLDERAVAGEQFITVQAIAAGNAMKVSSARAAVTVKSVYGATVEVPRSESAPGNVTLPILIRNVGNSPDPLRAELDLPEGWRVATPGAVKLSVAPFASETERIALLVPAGVPVGSYRVGVKLTLPNGETRSAFGEIGILEARHATFDVRDVREEADRFVLDVRVTNAGNVRSPFQLLATPPPGWLATFDPSAALLAPGQSLNAVLTVTPPLLAPAGSHEVGLYAHFAGVQPASPEGLANRDAVKVTLEKPDVRVASFSTTPALDPDPLTRVLVRATVENVGSSPARGVTVALFVDDVFIERVVVDALAPGETRDVTLNWTAVGGKHALTVVADPFKDVPDASRENNAQSRPLVVTGPQQTVRGLPAETVETPFGGSALATLALIAIAALVAGGRKGRSWRSKR